MQNRFVGDIGDYGKYGLLRNIGHSGLRLGVNWYLTDDGTDSAGNLTEYLLRAEKGLNICDPDLMSELQTIVYKDNDRTVDRIENSSILPANTQYYSRMLKSGKQHRLNWFQDSLEHLAESEIVFLDPDNNILANDVGVNYGAEGSKYAFPGEIATYYQSGHSLIVYNHANRQNEEDYFRRFNFVMEESVFKNAVTMVMKYNRQQVRYYLFVLQPHHSEVIGRCLTDMLDGPWGNRWRWDKPHFEKMDLY